MAIFGARSFQDLISLGVVLPNFPSAVADRDGWCAISKGGAGGLQQILTVTRIGAMAAPIFGLASIRKLTFTL